MYGTAGGSDREDMVRLRFPISVGEIQIAGIRPRYTMTEAITPIATDADSDFKFPLLEASLALNFGPLSTHLSGGFLTYDEVVQVLPAAEKEYDRHANFLQLAAALRLGRFSIYGKIWNAENPQQYGLECGANSPIPVAPQRLNAKYFASTDNISDVDAYGWNIAGKYKIIPRKIALVVGYSKEYAERKDPGAPASGFFHYNLTINFIPLYLHHYCSNHMSLLEPLDPIVDQSPLSMARYTVLSILQTPAIESSNSLVVKTWWDRLVPSIL